MVQFDNTAVADSVFDRLATIQAECPVAWSDTGSGFWIVTKYEDIVNVCRDWMSFSNASGVTIPPTGATVRTIPGELDPPRHTQMRKLVLPSFTERAIERWNPGVRQLIVDAFAPVLPRGRAEIVHDVALPVPVLVICMVLGIERDWREIRTLAENFLLAAGSGDRELARQRSLELEAFIQEEIEARRGRPVVDMLGAFVNAEVDGEPLSADEALGLAQILVVAGHETTVNGMASMIYRLAAEPGLKERVLADRSLADKVIDETLRLAPPVWNLGRTVQRDAEVRGATMCPGERVMMAYAAGNRDADKFENPDSYDIDRRGVTQHLAFGSGRHRCIGEALARLELRTALHYVLDTIPDLELDGEPTFVADALQYGPATLPIKFTPPT